MSGSIGLGPLDEKAAALGAVISFIASLSNILAYGFLRRCSSSSLLSSVELM
jgi:hypothetical protein